MRINRTAFGFTLAACLVNGSVVYAQRAEDGRVGVSREQVSPSGSVGPESSRDTTVASVAREVRAGPRIAVGGVIGAILGVVYTVAAVNGCEKQPSGNNDMKGLCAIGFVTVGPAAVGGGALLGGFVGWLVARAQRE